MIVAEDVKQAVQAFMGSELDTYDCWIIFDLLNILQKRCHSLREIYGPLFSRKIEAQIEATGTVKP